MQKAEKQDVLLERWHVLPCSGWRVACKIPESSRHGCSTVRALPIRSSWSIEPKNFSAFRLLLLQLLQAKPLPAADGFLHDACIRCSDVFREKGQAQRRPSSSTMNSQADLCRNFSHSRAFLKVTIPVNETRWSRSRTSFASSSEPPADENGRQFPRVRPHDLSVSSMRRAGGSPRSAQLRKIEYAAEIS